MTNAIRKQSNGFLPGIDKFQHDFIYLYNSNPSFKSSLLVGFMQSCMTKLRGHKNAHYPPAVVNFFLALGATGDKKCVEFVSENLGKAITTRHLQRITAKRRNSPFITKTQDQMVKAIIHRFTLIRSKRSKEDCHIAFSVGFDATALYKAFQLSTSHLTIVGGAAPNHFISVDGMNRKEVSKILRECQENKRGDYTTKVKIAVVSFQNTPPEISPYFVLCGRPQTINENSQFCLEVMTACEIATKQDGNAVLLNSCTDGVSCEVLSNKKFTIDYLTGKINYLSLTDTNHNIKNGRGQVVSGSSAHSIGHYVIDAWQLKMAGVTKSLYRIEDWASDAIVLKLCSPQTILKLLNCKENMMDLGNLCVLTVSLTFLRLRSYAVNTNELPWKERCIYSLCTFLWFSSFHIPFSTMLPNKRNMLLETIGCLFLFTRSDVFEGRHCTSEAYEQTYGM